MYANRGQAAGLPPAVETVRLVKLFGSTPALIRADIVVPRATVVALTGANGAGKTTLLRLLATAIRPTAGTALVEGRDVRHDPLGVRGAIEFTPASGGFYPELSVVENLRFSLGMRGLHRSPAELRAALDRVRLSRERDTRARALSAGMLRRLGIARLLLTRPRIALLDEPYASLDDDGRAVIDELLDEVRREGRAAVVATHDRERIAGVADAAVRLHRGMVATDDGEPILDAPSVPAARVLP